MEMKRDIDVLLIHPPYHRRRGSGCVFPVGLGYLAAAAEATGYRAAIVDCAPHFSSLSHDSLSNVKKWLAERIAANPPRLAVGIGPCTTSAIKGVMAVSETCRSVLPNTPLIFGGPLTTIPGQAHLFFDILGASAIVSGDGEYVLCDVLRILADHGDLSALQTVTVSGRKTAPVNVIDDLDGLPFPKREWGDHGVPYNLSMRRDFFSGTFATIMASRGCPFRCRFCMSGHLRAGRYTRRSLSSVKTEIRHLRMNNAVKSIVFYDDTFFQNAATLGDEIDGLRRSFAEFDGDITWQAEIRPDVILGINPKMARSLYESGCRQLNIGVETGNRINTKSLGKHVNPEEIVRATRDIAAGAPRMRLAATFILGGPKETLKTITDTIAFSVDLGLLFAHFCPMEVYPGTELYAECFPDEGPLDWYHKVMMDSLPWGEIIFESPELTGGDLLRLVSEAYRSFYNRNEWHRMAQTTLGPAYREVASATREWCLDRFALAKETD